MYAQTQQNDDENDDAIPAENSTQSCVLCGDKERQKSRYATWGDIERTYLAKHLGSLLMTILLGKPLDLDSSSGSLPPVKMCSNPHCENETYKRLINPMFATNDKLAEIYI